MSAPLDMVAEFRTDLAYWETVGAMISEGSWTIPQVRAVACQLATTSPEEALAILDGVRKFEVGGAPKVVPVQMAGNVPTVTVTGHLDGPISAEVPAQDSGEALVGVECYVWGDRMEWSGDALKIAEYHWQRGYQVFCPCGCKRKTVWWAHARPVALGRPA